MPSLSQSKHVRALHRRKERSARGEFLVEGPRVLEELLRTERPVTLVLYTEAAEAEPDGRKLLEGIVAAGIPHELVSDSELRRHADTVTPQGWIAVAPVPRWSWSDFRTLDILVLDAVQDPGNVGTLIRAAEALGASGVVALPGTADPWSPKVVRAASGSSIRLPVLAVAWDEAVAHLRMIGCAVWASAADGDLLERGATGPDGVALVLGNESRGVSGTIRAAADRIVAIPMRGDAESLNAALAGAILMDRLFGG
jgi:TrmH family RNA methyltransferase